MKRGWSRIAACTLLLGACATAPPARAPDTTAGRLVIVGGGLSSDNEAIYRTVLDGRRDSGPICVLPTASGGEPQATIDGNVRVFERWGGTGSATGIEITPGNAGAAATDTAVVRSISACAGFWFTGGVQSRVTTAFRPRGTSTPAYDALLQRHRAGAVIGGSSAGAAIMSDPMIAAGSTRGALASGVSRIPAEADEDDDAEPVNGVAIAPGLGFLPGVIVDQHFLARGRIGRLVAAVLDLDEYEIGFGVDENTALVVDHGIARVVGESGVVVIDARAALRSGRGASDIVLHLLGDGDRFEISSGAMTFAADKRPLATVAAATPVPDDVFARWAFLRLLNDFAASSGHEVRVRFEGGELRLRKGPDFAAARRDGSGVQETPAAFAVRGVLLDVIR